MHSRHFLGDESPTAISGGREGKRLLILSNDACCDYKIWKCLYQFNVDPTSDVWQSWWFGTGSPHVYTLYYMGCRLRLKGRPPTLIPCQLSTYIIMAGVDKREGVLNYCSKALMAFQKRHVIAAIFQAIIAVTV